jgi:hypothetical protein
VSCCKAPAGLPTPLVWAVRTPPALRTPSTSFAALQARLRRVRRLQHHVGPAAGPSSRGGAGTQQHGAQQPAPGAGGGLRVGAAAAPAGLGGRQGVQRGAGPRAAGAHDAGARQPPGRARVRGGGAHHRCAAAGLAVSRELGWGCLPRVCCMAACMAVDLYARRAAWALPGRPGAASSRAPAH